MNTGDAATVSPFEDFRALAQDLPKVDAAYGKQVAGALQTMGRERDFGILGDAAEWIASVQKRYPPRIEKPTLAVFAGAHGIAEQGASLSSDSNTAAHVKALTEGTAPLSAIAAVQGATVRVFELAISQPTPSIADAEAMSEKECAANMAFGFEALADQPDLLSIAVSGAGIGTAAAAVACALYGGTADYWVRPSPEMPDDVAKARVDLVEQALARHRSQFNDPLQTLRVLGGRELAACVGAIIAAGNQGVPVLLDGFATTIAAGVAHALSPGAIRHVMAAHVTRRPAHEAALERMSLKPLLELDFQVGGGLGSTTAIGLLKTACAPFALSRHSPT